MDISLIGALAARDGFIAPGQLDRLTTEPKTTLAALPISDDEYRALCNHVQEVARQQMQLEEVAHRSRDDVVRGRFRSIALHCFRELDIHVPEPDAPVLVQRLFDDILGYGPLERHFWDTDVTEIKVNNTRIRVEKHGKEEEVGERFESVNHARQIVERMIAPSGRRLDLAEPEVNARLFDGSRLIAQIAPVAVDGVLIAIRRFRHDITASELIRRGSISAEVLDFIEAAVASRLNIVVSGGTSSGKTTFLNVVASFIPEKESILTIEDPAELQLQHPDVRRLEARPPNIEGKGGFSLGRLLQSGLRMAPDRIIVGEVRGEEAFHMIQAMNSGHPGSLTTGHANSAQHFLSGRLVNMIQQAGMGLPYDAILDQIAEAIDLGVHIVQDKEGRRRLDHIVETAGVERTPQGKTVGIKFNPLWQYDPKSLSGWHWTAKQFLRADVMAHKGGWQCPP